MVYKFVLSGSLSYMTSTFIGPFLNVFSGAFLYVSKLVSTNVHGSSANCDFLSDSSCNTIIIAFLALLSDTACGGTG